MADNNNNQERPKNLNLPSLVKPNSIQNMGLHGAPPRITSFNSFIGNAALPQPQLVPNLSISSIGEPNPMMQPGLVNPSSLHIQQPLARPQFDPKLSSFFCQVESLHQQQRQQQPVEQVVRDAVEEDKEQDVSPLLSLRPTQVKNFVSDGKDADSQNSKKRDVKALGKKAQKFEKMMAKIDVTAKAKSSIAKSPKQSNIVAEEAKPAPLSKQVDNPQQASRLQSSDQDSDENDLNGSFDNLEDGEGAQSDLFPIDEEFNLGNYTQEEMVSLTQITQEMNRRMDMARGNRRGRKVQDFGAYCKKTIERINTLKNNLKIPEATEDKKKQTRNQIAAFQARLKQRIQSMDQELRLEQKNQQLSTVLTIVSKHVGQDQLGSIFSRLDQSFPEMDFYNSASYKQFQQVNQPATTNKRAKTQKPANNAQ